jgi:hypothetical protein
VITILISLDTVVDNGFILSDPLRAGGGNEPVLTTFEAYQATRERRSVPPIGADTLAPKISDADLHRRFETLRAERIAQRRFDATKSLVTSAVLLMFAAFLFVWHWAWLSRDAKDAVDDVQSHAA